jgi:hypothetical protein
MKEWIKKLLSASKEVSHKRILTLFFGLNVIIFCYIELFTIYELPIAMFDGVCLLVASGFGATVIERFSNGDKSINNTKEQNNG